MRFLLSVYDDASSWGALPEDERERELEAFGSFEREATAGAPRFAERSVSGPAMGCFYVVDADAPEQAWEWAGRIPLVGRGGFDRVEIRPFMVQERM
jgi:hypothetical protein